MRGALIIDDPRDPYARHYDEEYTITVSDWYFTESLDLVRSILSPDNPHGLMPLPDAAIINDGQPAEYEFDPTKTYRVRLISYSALAAFMIQADKHSMTVIMTDGVYTEPVVVNQLRMAPGQRYDVLIKGSNMGGKSGNFPILFSLDHNADWTLIGDDGYAGKWPYNVTADFVEFADEERPDMVVPVWAPEDDSFWHTFRHDPRLPDPTWRFIMDFVSCLDEAGIPR